MQARSFRIFLKERRERAGLSQKVVASTVGISRQALISVEAGRQVPSTATALRLAELLGCRVEDLFRLEHAEQILAQLAITSTPGQISRVALGEVGGRWVAFPLNGSGAMGADGVVVDMASADRLIVQPLMDRRGLAKNIVVAGCAPLLGVLAGRMATRIMDAQLRWVAAGSDQALQLLSQGLVHVAGTHLFDEGSGEDNISEVQARFGSQRMTVVNLVRWEQGLVVAKGNPLAIRGPADLTRTGLRVARREPGSGAHRLLMSTLTAHGIGEEDISSGPTLSGHMEVVRAVALGAADVGVTIGATARGAGLEFLPLAIERFDLVLPTEVAGERWAIQLMEAINDHAFRREVEAIGGYDMAKTGHRIVVDGQEEQP